MCCEDVRIGQGVFGGKADIALTTSSQEVLSANDKRRTLILPAPISGTTTWSLGEAAVAGQGIVLGAGQTPIVLTLQHHGRLTCQSVHVIHSAGSVNSSVLFGEVVEDECKS